MMRGDPDGAPTTRIEGGPASPVWPPLRIVAHEDDDRRVGMWTSENRMSTFPQRITYVELAFGGRFIEGTESTEAKRRRGRTIRIKAARAPASSGRWAGWRFGI